LADSHRSPPASDLLNIHPVGATPIHVDRWAGRRNLEHFSLFMPAYLQALDN